MSFLVGSRLAWAQSFDFRQHEQRRRAFTLVEVLVVIAIIGVLIGLLLPAVQSARESARSAQCRNNLRQIGLGVQAYVETFGYYPPGNTQRYLTHGQLMLINPPFGHGWMISILPFVEQQQLFNSYVITTKYDYPVNDQTTNLTMRTAKVPLYVCPADTADGPFTPMEGPALEFDPFLEYMPGSYRAVTGRTDGTTFFDFTISGYENPNIPNTIRAEWRGAIHFTWPRIMGLDRQLDVTDGLSSTLLVGENTDRADPTHGSEPWASGYGGAWAYPYGFYTMSIASLEPATLRGNYNRCVDATGKREVCKRGWGGAHTGGVNFLLCDGSVRTVPTSIDMQLFCELSTIAGGGPATLGQ